MRAPLRLLVALTLVASASACRQISNEQRAAVASRVDIMVRDFRRVVLLSSDPNLDEASLVAAGVFFRRNRVRLEDLAGQLVRYPALADPLYDKLDQDPGLQDPDKLLFRELLSRLPVSARRDLLMKTMNDSAAQYGTEIGQLPGRVTRRGPPRHQPAWDRYLALVRAQETRDQVLRALAAERKR